MSWKAGRYRGVSSPMGFPPRMRMKFRCSALKMEGQRLNWTRLQKGMADHSSVLREQISGGAMESGSGCGLWSGCGRWSGWSGGSLRIPPNLRMYLSLQVVTECLLERCLRECMMQTWLLWVGTNFSHLTRQPSRSFSPPMMQISPLSRHTPNCLRQLSIDFTLVKASSAVRRQSYLTMSLLALSPSPMMQQQLPWGKQTDWGVPAQLYLVPSVSASLEWEMRFMAAMGWAASCFWSCVREYRQHCPSQLVKRWKLRMRSCSGVALEMVNIFSKLCSKLVSRLKIRSFSMAVLKERIFLTKIQLKQLSKQRTQCRKSCLKNKCRPSSSRFYSRPTSRCRTCYDRPITSSNSSNFQRTWLEQTLLMLLRKAYSLALINLPISSNLASNSTNPGLFTMFSYISWFFLALTPCSPVSATLPTRSASSPASRHPSCSLA